jgi:hypothetical protein
VLVDVGIVVPVLVAVAVVVKVLVGVGVTVPVDVAVGLKEGVDVAVWVTVLVGVVVPVEVGVGEVIAVVHPVRACAAACTCALPYTSRHAVTQSSTVPTISSTVPAFLPSAMSWSMTFGSSAIALTDTRSDATILSDCAWT